MTKIAITGGLGQGKSVVCDILTEMGYPVIRCKNVYNGLLETTEFAYGIDAVFPGTRLADGTLDRAKLYGMISHDEDKAKQLREITNPFIIKQAVADMEYLGFPFCEVPLLFENGYETLFDDVVIVNRDSPVAMCRYDYAKNSDYISKYHTIDNHGNLNDLRINVRKCLEDLRRQHNI